jgi:O-methyltransferase
MTELVPRRVAEAVPRDMAQGSDLPTLARWLMAEGRDDPSVRQWINFLAAHYARFRIIRELFPRVNPGRTGMKDACSTQTIPEEMLAIANQLFILKSHGVEGAVLECGCFKGYSSCCLSVACRHLGYPLVIADSFAGLPPVPDGGVAIDAFGQPYQAGDFAGSRVEVEQNLRSLGCPDGVELVEGWFSDTLKDWSRPLALLWLDVDLYASAMDVLKPCLPAIDPRGCIFTHEISPDQIRDSKIVDTSGVAGALAHALQEDDRDYEAEHVRGSTAIVGRHTSLCVRSHRLLNEMIPALCLIGLPWFAIPRSRLERLAIRAQELVDVLRGRA